MAERNEDGSASGMTQKWADSDIRDVLSESAKNIGAGSPTDAGRRWRLPTEREDPIVLAGGIPDMPTVPVADFQESILAVLAEETEDAMNYGGWLGFEGLRESVAKRQSEIEGIDVTPDHFIMHNGSSGALDNVCKAFINPGDVVIVERPSFSGTVRSMQGYMAEIVEVDIDKDGISVDDVRQALAEATAAGKTVKFVYTIADYHNPTGATMNLERRKALLELCGEYNVLVLEDAAYTELYFDDSPPPSLFAMGGGEGVLRMGSFSKIIATGLRSGWVEAAPRYTEALARVRFDMGNNPLIQRALARYVDSGALEPHVENMRDLYRQKCDALANSLEEFCEPYVRFNRPEGGFFLWVECIGVGAMELTQTAAREGLMFPAGAFFYRDGAEADDSHVRLAFSNAPIEELQQAGQRMRDVFQMLVD